MLLGHRIFIYRQNRIGRNGNSFTMYKFKTLLDDQSLSFQDRKFAFGGFLRNSSLDELPQLFNILKGEMSLIGPRALPYEYLNYIPEEYLGRFDIKPGITGLAQVNGRSKIDWKTKFEWDLIYLKKKSLFIDIQIALKTILNLIFKENKSSLNEISLIDYIESEQSSGR